MNTECHRDFFLGYLRAAGVRIAPQASPDIAADLIEAGAWAASVCDQDPADATRKHRFGSLEIGNSKPTALIVRASAGASRRRGKKTGIQGQAMHRYPRCAPFLSVPSLNFDPVIEALGPVVEEELQFADLAW